MQTRQQAITYGLSFPHTYVEAPFKDPNWELVRVKGSKKAFLWIYEKDGYINLNIKVDPEWRDFWREAYDAVIPGYHQNKKYWNTIILDGTIPEKDIKKMIKESYDIITDSPTKRIYEAVKQIPKRTCRNLWAGGSYGRKQKDVKSRRKRPAQKSRPRTHSMLQGSQCQRRTCRSLRIRRRRKTEKVIRRRRSSGRRWEG